MFNKFFISFVKDVKEITNEGMRSIIKKKYKVVDKMSTDHLVNFWNSCESNFEKFVSTPSVDLSKDQEICDISIFSSSIKLSDILTVFPKSELFWNHMYILLVFAFMYYDEEEGDDEGDDVLLNKVVEAISYVQKGQYLNDQIDEIVDDDIKALLSKLVLRESAPSNPEEKQYDDNSKSTCPPFDISDVFGDISKDSKIASLAKEISEEIDISNFKLEKPEDIMKMMDFSSSNNVMGQIIKSVSSKISNKMESGELGQEELLSEAMSMMSMLGKSGSGMGGLGSLFNNPMMCEMMKSMKKGKPMQTRNDVISRATTRDRLKKKLDDKNKST